MSDTLIELSRWQFALTAMFHFIFVPLTLGLSFLLAIMESVYVMTGKEKLALCGTRANSAFWQCLIKFRPCRNGYSP